MLELTMAAVAAADAGATAGMQMADAPSEPGATLVEHVAVVAGEGEQVDVRVESTGAGDERHGRRVAVISWAMPPESSWRSMSTKPASVIIVCIASASGR